MKKSEKNGIFAFSSVLAVFLMAPAFFVLAAAPANDVALSMSPATSTVPVDSIFTINILVSSPSISINAVSGRILLPIDRLKIVSIDKDNSILGLWVDEPTLSDDGRTVYFSGVSLGSGFKGLNRQVLSLKFRAASIGTTTVLFASSSVLAHDGKGTALPVNDDMGANISIVNSKYQNIWNTDDQSQIAGISPCNSLDNADFWTRNFSVVSGTIIFLLVIAALLLLVMLMRLRCPNPKERAD